MKIVVCIKQVPEREARLRIDTGGASIVESDVATEINESDQYALEAGLRLGYGLARETLTENGIDRIVLASDGVANVGLTDPESILAGIREDAAAGIELV